MLSLACLIQFSARWRCRWYSTIKVSVWLWVQELMYATVYAVSCGTCELEWRAPLSVLSVFQSTCPPHRSTKVLLKVMTSPLQMTPAVFLFQRSWSFSHLQHTYIHLNRVQHRYCISSTALSWFSSMSQIEHSQSSSVTLALSGW